LQELWREILSADPAWRYYPAVRTIQHLLDTSAQRLPSLSLMFLLVAVLVPARERVAARERVYQRLKELPSSKLQQEAVSIVETATRYVAVAALKRSLLVWVLAPVLGVAFVVWSVQWGCRSALEGAPQAALQLARARLRHKVLGPLAAIVTSESRM
jgi:hypothetical protein